jgi:hypothetical protein
MLRAIARLDLLILDDWGLEPHDADRRGGSSIGSRSVTLAASGTLFVDGRIEGKTYVRTFPNDSWDSFEVKHIRG